MTKNFFAGEDSDFIAINKLLQTIKKNKFQREGSRHGRSSNIKQNRLKGALQLLHDYLSSTLTYPLHLFERQYRIFNHQFFDNCAKLKQHYEYLWTKKHAVGLVGFNAYQKNKAILQLLPYKVFAPSLDENTYTSESTALRCLQRFEKAAIERYASENLRPLNFRETKNLLQGAASLELSNMFRSVDCCKQSWKTRSKAYHEQYKGT